MLQLFRDDGKHIFKLSSTEFSRQLSGNDLHDKSSSPLHTTQAGSKTDGRPCKAGKEAGTHYRFTRSRARHTQNPIVTLQGGLTQYFFLFEERESQKG